MTIRFSAPLVVLLLVSSLLLIVGLYNAEKHLLYQSEQQLTYLPQSNDNDGRTVVARDLLAQESMAYWTRVTAFTAIGALLLTAFGIALLKETLEATRGAVREAEEATAAANKSVEVARQTGQNQVRAYLYVKPQLIFHGRPQPTKYVVHICNCGHSPAYKVGAHGRAAISVYPLQGRLPPIEVEPELSVALLAPGQEPFAIEEAFPPITPEESVALANDTSAIYIWGQVHYSDIFGIERSTPFCFAATGSQFRNGDLIPIDDGRVAT